MYCEYCGNIISEDANFCSNCGKRIKRSVNNFIKQKILDVNEIDKKDSVTINGIEIPLHKSSYQTVQDFVKRTLEILFNNNLLTDEEIENLKDLEYSKRTFGISHALLKEDYYDIFDNAGHARYWTRYQIKGFYVCSQWWRMNFPIYERKVAEWIVKLSKESELDLNSQSINKEKQNSQSLESIKDDDFLKELNEKFNL